MPEQIESLVKKQLIRQSNCQPIGRNRWKQAGKKIEMTQALA